MLRDMINLANRLDKKGLTKEADVLDNIVTRANFQKKAEGCSDPDPDFYKELQRFVGGEVVIPPDYNPHWRSNNVELVISDEYLGKVFITLNCLSGEDGTQLFIMARPDEGEELVREPEPWHEAAFGPEVPGSRIGKVVHVDDFEIEWDSSLMNPTTILEAVHSIINSTELAPYLRYGERKVEVAPEQYMKMYKDDPETSSMPASDKYGVESDWYDPEKGYETLADKLFAEQDWAPPEGDKE